jgi:hypothetical protein
MRHPFSVRLSAQFAFTVCALLCGTASLCSAQQLKTSVSLGFSVRVAGPADLEPSLQLLPTGSKGNLSVLVSRTLLADRQGQVITRIRHGAATQVVSSSTSVSEILAQPSSRFKKQFELQFPAPTSDSEGAVLEIEFLQL